MLEMNDEVRVVIRSDTNSLCKSKMHPGNASAGLLSTVVRPNGFRWSGFRGGRHESVDLG